MMPNILTDNKMVIDRMYAGELPGRDELKQLLSCHSKEEIGRASCRERV